MKRLAFTVLAFVLGVDSRGAVPKHLQPTDKELDEWIVLANRKAKSNTIYTTSFQRNAMRAVARIAYRAGIEKALANWEAK